VVTKVASSPCCDQVYPGHTIPSHVRKILFSIVLRSTTMTSKCLLSFRSPVRKFVCISLFSRATCFDLITLMSGEEYKFWRARYIVCQDKVFLTNPGNGYYCIDDSEVKAPRPARLDSSLHITSRPGKRGSLFSSFLLLWSVTCRTLEVLKQEITVNRFVNRTVHLGRVYEEIW
jgi:hypothetical protein